MASNEPSSGRDSVRGAIKDGLRRAKEDQEKHQNRNCTIFRVRERERKQRPEHFQHEVLSLGLLDRPISQQDHHSPKTTGDLFRLRVVSALLCDLGRTDDDWDVVCGKLVPTPRDMQMFNEEGYGDLQEDVIHSLLALDAVFLACFLGSIFHEDFGKFFKNVDETCRRTSYSFQQLLLMDIMKLENQIPLTLIKKASRLILKESVSVRRRQQSDEMGHSSEELDANQLYPDTSASEELDANQLYTDTWASEERVANQLYTDTWAAIGRGFESEYSASIPGGLDFSQDKQFRPHLLSMLYGAARLNFQGPLIAAPNAYSIEYVLEKVRKSLSSSGSSAWNSTWSSARNSTGKRENHPYSSNEICLPSATELQDAGIEFCGLQGGLERTRRNTRLSFRVHSFSYKATVYLPAICSMTPDAVMLWRNLMAYLCESDSRSESNHFLAYLQFMDNLIDTDDDVAILKRGNEPVIFHHNLGSKKAVATVLNSMLSNYTIRPPEEWRELYRAINKHYRKRSVRLIVHMKVAYFDLTKPWLFISVLAATTLLVLTLLQTIYD